MYYCMYVKYILYYVCMYVHLIAPPTPSTFKYKNLPFAAPEHSLIDLTASCPRCLADAASKPNGSEGEFTPRVFHMTVVLCVWLCVCVPVSVCRQCARVLVFIFWYENKNKRKRTKFKY